MKSSSKYYPFGSPMPNRTFSSNSYRYGFNKVEKDNELLGDNITYDTYFRTFDSRIGRWFSLDIITDPGSSGYTSMANNPIYFIDPLGDRIKPGSKEVKKDIKYLRKNDKAFDEKYKSWEKKYKGRTLVINKTNQTTQAPINGADATIQSLENATPQSSVINCTTCQKDLNPEKDFIYYNRIRDRVFQTTDVAYRKTTLRVVAGGGVNDEEGQPWVGEEWHKSYIKPSMFDHWQITSIEFYERKVEVFDRVTSLNGSALSYTHIGLATTMNPDTRLIVEGLSNTNRSGVYQYGGNSAYDWAQGDFKVVIKLKAMGIPIISRVWEISPNNFQTVVPNYTPTSTDRVENKEVRH